MNGNQEAGSYEAEFDGSGFASGIYFYRIVSGEFSQTKRMMLLK
ncbi:MAG: T9SS type A sorting domain-containing protein [Ignavibacteria bacterium]|nr:T9SS type A sorting domain-containing protein [Ignavibacteria bacterium]